MLSSTVQQKLETLPARPGVYVFRDAAGGVLYVGKARSLRSRVRSYFQPGTSDVRAFVSRLERELADIETFVAASEKEAALLENQLIKEHQPRYNVKLRDDKDFLSLRLDPAKKWPRLEAVRRPREDGAMYFGPYHSATAARQTLRLVNRHFQLRTCTDQELRSRTRPCLQHQIGRCPAPCVLDVDEASYDEQVRNVGLFLEGRHDELIEQLEQRMRAASAELRFEQAAVLRDQMRAVDRVRETQRVTSAKDVDQDVLGFYRQGDRAEIAVLMVRSGKLVAVRTYDLRDVALPDDELLARFVAAWYERAAVPDEVVLPLAIEAMDGLAAVLAERRRSMHGSSRMPKVWVPQRGPRRKLLEMAQQNAAHAFEEKRLAAEDVERRLGEIQRRLRLPTRPTRIECVDISHSGGRDTVAAIVSMRDGAPERARYRRYHVKTVAGGDDYGAMYEVLARRFRRGRDAKRDGEESKWAMPDLMVVDGGKGQLGVALGALQDLGIEGLSVVGLAKEKSTPFVREGEEAKVVDRIYVPGAKNAIPVQSSPALQLLAFARDEAHRVSNAFRIELDRKRRIRSELDDVPGVGPKTRAKLLAHFGSVDAMRDVDEAALRSAGATKRQAKALLEAFARPVAPNVSRAEKQAVDRAFEEE